MTGTALDATTAPSRASAFARLLRRGARALLSVPFTLVLLAAIATVTVLTRDRYGVLLFIGGALLALAERRLGTARVIVAFVGTAAVGALLGVAAQALLGRFGSSWEATAGRPPLFDPLTGVAGALMVASAFAPLRSRRRLRFLTLTVTIMMLLYLGSAADLYRIIAALAGLGAGVAANPRSLRREWERSSHHETRVLMASVVAISAVGPLIALAARTPRGVLTPIAVLMGQGASSTGALLPCHLTTMTDACIDTFVSGRIATPGTLLTSAMPMLVMLFIAYGLLHGRRFAVWMGASLNLVIALLAAAYFGFGPTQTASAATTDAAAPGAATPVHTPWDLSLAVVATIAVPAATALALIVLRRHFDVAPARGAAVRYVRSICVAAVGLAAVYVAVGWMLRDTAFTSPVGISQLLADAGQRFMPVAIVHRHATLAHSHTPGAAILRSVGPAFWLIVLLAAVRPMSSRPTTQGAGDRARARRLMEQGGDHLSFMTTWKGNSYWFTPDGDGAVAYRVLGSIALTTGGVLGDVDPAPVVAGFARYCDDRGWTPVLYSVDEERYGEVFAELDWQTVTVADEAVIDLQNWNLAGRRWQKIRSAVNKAEREGVTSRWVHYADLSRAEQSEIAEISEQWVSDKGLPEMGFTLGGIDELRDREVLIGIAKGADGSVLAVTSWLPSFDRGTVVGWTLEFMRRGADAPHGVMEYLIATAAQRIRDSGYAFMSLSAAPLARLAGDDGTVRRGPSASDTSVSAVDGVLATLSRQLEPLYGFSSLLVFKSKFNPVLRPLVMGFPDAAALPAIGIALVRAYLPSLSLGQAARLLRPGSAASATPTPLAR